MKLEPNVSVTLENSRVQLIPLSMEYLDDLYAIASDNSLWAWGYQAYENKDQFRQYIFQALQEYHAKASIPFVVIDKASGKVAGSTRYASIVNQHKRVEIGYTWIGKAFQGTGLNKAMKYEMLNYAFDIMGMNRVELKTDVLNVQSRKAIKKLGAKEEGILKAHMVCGTGRVRDTVYYSIIQSDWAKIKETVFSEFVHP
ncbi:MAG TPA: GNAT family protein [Cytophagaceae bacterium]